MIGINSSLTHLNYSPILFQLTSIWNSTWKISTTYIVYFKKLILQIWQIYMDLCNWYQSFTTADGTGWAPVDLWVSFKSFRLYHTQCCIKKQRTLKTQVLTWNLDHWLLKINKTDGYYRRRWVYVIHISLYNLVTVMA